MVENIRSEPSDTLIIWPAGASVSHDKQPQIEAKTEFSTHSDGWQVTVALPFKEIGQRQTRVATLTIGSN